MERKVQGTSTFIHETVNAVLSGLTADIFRNFLFCIYSTYLPTSPTLRKPPPRVTLDSRNRTRLKQNKQKDDDKDADAYVRTASAQQVSCS